MRCIYCKVRIPNYRTICDKCTDEVLKEKQELDMVKSLTKVGVTTDEVSTAFEAFKCAQKEQKLRVSESYIIGIDISGGDDLSCLTVSKCKGSKIEHVSTFYGEEAEWMYHRFNDKQPIAMVIKNKKADPVLGYDWTKDVRFSSREIAETHSTEFRADIGELHAVIVVNNWTLGYITSNSASKLYIASIENQLINLLQKERNKKS